MVCFLLRAKHVPANVGVFPNNKPQCRAYNGVVVRMGYVMCSLALRRTQRLGNVVKIQQSVSRRFLTLGKGFQMTGNVIRTYLAARQVRVSPTVTMTVYVVVREHVPQSKPVNAVYLRDGGLKLLEG